MIFKLQMVLDNPIYDGFAFAEGATSLIGRTDFKGRPDPYKDFKARYDVPKDVRLFEVASLAGKWKPQPVEGRVSLFIDYACIGALIPAFSRRAVDTLRDFLESNEELLPLKTDVGEYYAYNLRTIADVLDVAKSDIDFFPPARTHAVGVDRFEFRKPKLKGLSIFRIPELAVYTLVTDEFKRRVEEHGLNGFHFVKVWPWPKGVEWAMEEAKRRRKAPHKVKTPKGDKKIKAHTVVIFFTLAKKKASAAEKKLLKRYKDELDAQLVLPSLEARYFGSLEGTDTVDGEARLFLSCPDADALVDKLRPWINAFDWPREIYVIKRAGDMYDEDAPEEIVELK